MADPLGDILGQDHAIHALRAPLETGRPHHAYLFHGPAGVGKFTTALAFAHQLLTPPGGSEPMSGNQAPAPGDQQPTGDSPPSNPDLHVITKELARYHDDKKIRERKLTRIPLEVLRTYLIGPAYHAAHGNRGKVFIVDEAELLNPQGQNALLKTLEEPPPQTRIILVTANEDGLLPTVRSRCQRVAFVPLPTEAIAQWVQQHAGGWKSYLKDWLVQFADGSLGRARLAVDYHLGEWAERVLRSINAMMREGKTDAALGGEMARFIDGFAQTWVNNHKNASKESANKQAAGLMWAMIAAHARSKMADAAQRCENADAAETAATLGPWLGIIDALGEAQRLLGANVNLGLICDDLALRITAAATGGAGAEVLAHG